MTRLLRRLGPSPLRRAFGALDKTVPLVTVEVEGWGTLTDLDLFSVSLRRGGDDDIDILPAVLTVETVYALPLLTGNAITLKVDGQTRFHGRVGPMAREDDQGDYTTKITASSWSVLLDQLDRESTWSAGESWASILGSVSNLSAMGVPWSINIADDRLWNITGAPEPGAVKYSDAIRALTTDSGVAILSRMDGTADALTHTTRGEYADTVGQTYPTIPRTVCTTPTTWEQPTELPARRVYLKYRDEAGVEKAYSAPYREENITETRVIDRLWWRASPASGLTSWADVIAVRESSRYWQLPKLSIELLPLINSPLQSRRNVYVYLRSMQSGSPIPLGGDWERDLQGLHFATGIEETMTATNWTMTLSLLPYSHMIGRTTPPVLGQTWDTMITTWDETPGRWDL